MSSNAVKPPRPPTALFCEQILEIEGIKVGFFNKQSGAKVRIIHTYFDTLRPTVEEKAKDNGFLYLNQSKDLGSSVGSDTTQVGGANGSGPGAQRHGHANGRTNGNARGGSSDGNASRGGSSYGNASRGGSSNGNASRGGHSNGNARGGSSNVRTNVNARGGSVNGGSSNSGSVLNPEAHAWRQNGVQNGVQNGGQNGGQNGRQHVPRYAYVEDYDDSEDEIATQNSRYVFEDSPAALHASRSQMFRQSQAHFERPGSTGSHRRTNTTN